MEVSPRYYIVYFQNIINCEITEWVVLAKAREGLSVVWW